MIPIFFSALTPWLTKWLASDIRQRALSIRHYYLPKLFTKVVQAEVYVAFDDPYSYLLIQVLPEFEQRFNIKFKLRLTNDKQPGMNPEPKMWRQWAINDAKAVAAQYKLCSPTQYPTSKSVVSAQQLWQLERPNLAQALNLFHRVWQQHFIENFPHSTPVINHLIKNQLRQTALGHYSPATIFFAGQWFQGIDRLDHFESLLLSLNLAKSSDESVTFNKRELLLINTSIKNAVHEPIEMYLSIRSPYSHIGLTRVKQLAEHYQVPLILKPVLPMVMRGMRVPRNKMLYLFLDTVREAKKYGIAYGKLRDPLGDGVINCYSLFSYAELQGKEIEYMQATYEAVNVHGKDLTSEQVMKEICDAAEINYNEALHYAKEIDWNIWADEYLQQLSALDLWGVPIFKYKDVVVWGQDRLWQIEHAILAAQEHQINQQIA